MEAAVAAGEYRQAEQGAARGVRVLRVVPDFSLVDRAQRRRADRGAVWFGADGLDGLAS